MNKEWQLVNFCEFDKYATKSYCAVHNVDESLNLGDITKVDETQLDDFTMMCGGSPCQDFSVAGKQAGAEWTCADCGHKYNPLEAHWSTRDKCPICGSQNIEKTRSSLLVEYLRILRAKHPKFAMYENVKNIVGKQFKKTFDMFIAELNEYGYNTYWKVLNAKDYGVPQNRERVYIFIVDKTLDNGKFEFPDGFDNGIRLKDVLETEVDDKYYLSEETTARFITSENSKESLSTRDYEDPRMINERFFRQAFETCVENSVNEGDTINAFNKSVNHSGISPTLTTRPEGFKTAILPITSNFYLVFEVHKWLPYVVCEIGFENFSKKILFSRKL